MNEHQKKISERLNQELSRREAATPPIGSTNGTVAVMLAAPDCILVAFPCGESHVTYCMN